MKRTIPSAILLVTAAALIASPASAQSKKRQPRSTASQTVREPQPLYYAPQTDFSYYNYGYSNSSLYGDYSMGRAGGDE